MKQSNLFFIVHGNFYLPSFLRVFFLSFSMPTFLVSTRSKIVFRQTKCPGGITDLRALLLQIEHIFKDFLRNNFLNNIRFWPSSSSLALASSGWVSPRVWVSSKFVLSPKLTASSGEADRARILTNKLQSPVLNKKHEMYWIFLWGILSFTEKEQKVFNYNNGFIRLYVDISVSSVRPHIFLWGGGFFLFKTVFSLEQ